MLFLKENRLGAHVVMSIGMADFSVAYILFCMLFAPWSGMGICISYMLFALLVPVFHFLFFKKAVDVNKVSAWAHVFVIIAFAVPAAMLALTLTAGPEMSDAFYHKVVMGEPVEVSPEYTSAPLWKTMDFVCFTVFSGLLAVGGTCVIIWTFVKITRYDSLLEEYFSGKEVDEKKNNLYVFLSAVMGIIPIVLLLARPFYLLRDNPVLIAVCLPLATVSVFLVGLYSYRIEYTAEQLRFAIDEDNEKRKLADDIPQDDVQTLGIIFNESLGRLKHAMDVDKVYLDPDLTLIGLSNKLKTNRTYLSKIINLNYNCTFSEFVNMRRIEHALSIIHDRKSKGLSLKEISAECGYANQASFIRNFSKIMGKTPSEYIADPNPEPDSQ